MANDPTTEIPASRLLAGVLTMAVVACACSSAPPGVDGTAGPDPSPTTPDALVDLTHPFGPDTLYWPTGDPFEYERTAWGENADGDWYAAGAFRTPEHLGTHLDAPIHFSERGWTAAEIPVDRLVGPGIVVSIEEKVAGDPDAMLQPQDVVRWERENGPVPAGSIVLVRAGWSARWPDPVGYFGSETPDDTTTLHFPGISPEAARLLVQRGVAGVGIDTASLDHGPSSDFPTHRILGDANVFGLENLARLEELPARGFRVLALSMKIAGGTGGPARVVAMLDAGSS